MIKLFTATMTCSNGRGVHCLMMFDNKGKVIKMAKHLMTQYIGALDVLHSLQNFWIYNLRWVENASFIYFRNGRIAKAYSAFLFD